MIKNTLIKLTFLLLSVSIFSQTQFEVNVNGIKENDSIRVIVQKSSEFLLKRVDHMQVIHLHQLCFHLAMVDWAVKLDATGYTYPSQQVVMIPQMTRK